MSILFVIAGLMSWDMLLRAVLGIFFLVLASKRKQHNR